MAGKRFILSIGKLLIAASWADGKLTADEVNSLRSLVYRLPNLTEDDWNSIEVYTDSKVGPEEARDILDEVLSGIETEEDKELVIESFKTLIESDGEITEEERAMFEDVKKAVAKKRLGFFSQVGMLIKMAKGQPLERKRSGVTREDRVEDYLENNIYFTFVSEMETQDVYLDLPEDELKMLCVAAGLMARVAWVDENITESEKKSIRLALVENWELDEEVADLVTEISCEKVANLDYSLLSRNFCKFTTREERLGFIKCLFEIIKDSDEKLHKAIEEIKAIARSLMLQRRDFIEAKLDKLF